MWQNSYYIGDNSAFDRTNEQFRKPLGVTNLKITKDP